MALGSKLLYDMQSEKDSPDPSILNLQMKNGAKTSAGMQTLHGISANYGIL